MKAKTPFKLMEPEGPAFARNIILDADGLGVGCSYLPLNANWEDAKAEGEKLAQLFSTSPELLEALEDLTDQILADWNAGCLHLLPESKEFKAALAVITKAK